MAGLWYEAERPAFFTPARGEASFLDVYAASRDAALLVDNTFAAEAAIERAYEARNRRVFTLTGERLRNPMDVDDADARALGDFGLPVGRLAVQERQRRDWLGQLRELAARRPELAAELMPSTSIEDEALAISREAEERFINVAGSRDGASKWIAVLAGGVAGASRDPLQVATWALGGGPGAARTVLGRIAMTAATEFAVNAGVELALSPFNQAYRARAGLESGVDVALQNAAFAGLLGGLLGAGGRSVVEALTFGGRSAERAAAAAELPPEILREVETRAAEIAPGIREQLPRDIRGAVDAAELIDHLDGSRPPAASADVHDRAVTTAHRKLDDLAAPDFTPDPAQIARISDEIAGPAPAIADAPQSLVQFLEARGGVLDDGGALAAMGAERLTRNRARRGRPDKRVPLDLAREAAEEAGYIGRAGDVQTTTIADLLDAIDRELRGTPVYAREDLERVQPLADHEAMRAQVEERVEEVVRIAGPAIEDRLIREAAEMSLREDIDAFDALERVLIRAEQTSEASPVPRSADDDLPGWSRAELEAAAAVRGPEPKPQNGSPFDDPGKVPDMLGFADHAGPFAPSWDASAVRGDWGEAVKLLRTQQAGEVRGILSHPETGPIDVPWGFYDPATDKGFGLAKIVAKHPEVVNTLPEIVRAMPGARRVQNKMVLESDIHAAIVRLDYDDSAKTWLLTAYAWGPGEGPSGRRAGSTPERPDDRRGDTSSPPPAKGNVDDRADIDKIGPEVARLMEERAEREMLVPGEDGPVTLGELVDELEHDEAIADAVRTCPI